jgi:hypothetical protein
MQSALCSMFVCIIICILTIVFVCKRTQQQWFCIFICLVVLEQLFSLVYYIYAWGNFNLSMLSVGLLMISLSLCGLFFYRALQFLGASQRFTRNCFYGFWLIAPKFFLSYALPLTSNFCLFSQSLFLWMLVRKNVLGILGSLFLCFLAHKHYCASFLCCTLCSFILIKFPKNVFVLILASCLAFYWYQRQGRNLYTFYKAKINVLSLEDEGNSYMPTNNMTIKRMSNAWFAPMFTNSEKFFYKAPRGSKLG